ncbi:MAG: TIGR02530 family flagellar biosynthesis protein [Bacillota bacterium]
MTVNKFNPMIHPSSQPITPPKARPIADTGTNKSVSFEELLHQEFQRQQGVKLSAHAEKRLKERDIILNETDLSRINQAVQKAAAKGSRDSLLLYGDLALVTSIANRTIITAVDSKNMEDHVFTNIDSAVIVK